jgi:site-specific recombinase XerD
MIVSAHKLNVKHFFAMPIDCKKKNKKIMSKSTFKILFYVRKNQVNKDGKASIMIRLSVNGEMSQFSSKLNIEPALWDVNQGRAKGNSMQSRQLNNYLEDIRTSLRNHYREIEIHEAYVTAEKIRNAFLGYDTKHQTLLELFRNHIEDARKLIGISKTAATVAKYDRTCRRLEEFINVKYKISDIALKEIGHKFITDFEIYLRSISKCSQNTTAKFIQIFRMIIIEAKNNGWIFMDPFVNYKIRFNRVDRGYLTDQEMQTIMDKEFVSKRLEQVRDIFIFSCFTGLAYVDVKHLTTDNIRMSFDGKLWIMTHRQKTDTPVNVPLLNIPLSILKKYEAKHPNGQLLPVLSNQKLNSYLKEIADLCGISKNMTFHMARHTFATTTTLSKGVPIETVSKMLGHTNIQTTQIYARITNEKISQDMQLLSGKLNDIEQVILKKLS